MSITRHYLLAFAFLFCTAAPVLPADLEELAYELDIQSQPLLAALKSLSDATGLEVLFFSDISEGVQSSAVAGRYSQMDALTQMLADSDLESVAIGTGSTVGIRLKGGDGPPGKSQPTSGRILIAQSSAASEKNPVANTNNSGGENAGRRNTRNPSSAIEEVLVTAQKRVTNLQDTALAITTFNEAELAKSGINNSMDLQLRTPGLVMSSNGGWGLPYLRGVGTDIIGPGVDSGVAIYVDGVYQARNAGKIQQLVDVARVEVLKGPQGILYGRNAIGGAINIISKVPSNEFTGNLGIDLGNFDQTGIRGSVSGPLIDNKLSGRLSFSNTDDDGYTQDLLSGDRYQYTDTSSVRGSLALSLTDKLDARINASWSDTESAFAYTPINPETNPLFTLYGATITGDSRKVLNDHPNQQETEEWGISARLNWDLGGFTMTSISAFNNSEYKLICDLDGTEVSLFTCGSPSFSDEPYSEKSDFFSQEFVLTSQHSGRLQWTALLYYMREDASLFGRNDLPLFGPIVTRTFADAETEAAAAAGQLSYALTDKLSLTGGVRISHEEKSFKNSSTSNGFPGNSADDKDSWTVPTPKIVIQYSPTDNIMVYASATRGFKSGGFNTFEIQSSFDQETLWSYEAGLRSTLLEQRLRANLTVFHYDYKDLQINQWRITEDRANGFGLVENAGEAAANGAELELLAKPFDNFQLEVGLAWLDAEFDDFISLDPDRTEDGLLDRAGNTLPRAPDFTASIAAEYSIPVGGGDLTLRGEYFYRDQIFFTPYEDDRTRVEAINITNARFSFASADEHWHAALYGKNLGDEDYAQYIITNQGLFGQIAVFAPPRTYGVQIGYNF